MKTNTHFLIYRSVLLRIRNIFDKSCREYQNTHSMFNNLFQKISPFIDKVEKYCRAGQAPDGKIIWRMDT
jgi:hypothetical protein